MELKDITKALRTLDNAELDTVIQIARELMVMNAKQNLTVGTEVYVVQKTKKTKGIVEKINIKKALVKIPSKGDLVYSVPLSMLEAAWF